MPGPGSADRFAVLSRYLAAVGALEDDYAALVGLLTRTISGAVGGLCVLFLTTPDGRAAQAVAAHDAEDPADARARAFLVGPAISLGTGPLGGALADGTARAGPAVAAELETMARGAASGDAIALPLVDRETIHGVAAIMRRAGPLDGDTRALCELLVQDAAHRLHETAVQQNLRRVVADLRLATSRRKELEELVDSAAMAVLRLDPDGHIRFASAGASRLLGYARKELVGGGPGPFLDHRSRGELLHAIEQATALGEPRRALVHCRTAHGRVIPVLASAAPVRNARGEAVITLEDVEPWIEPPAESPQPEPSREEFLQVVVHELRTPLNAMKLGLESLRRRRPGELAPDVVQRLDGMARQVERLARFVGHVDASSTAAVAKDEEHALVDLAAIVRAVAADFGDDLLRVGSEIQLDAPAEAMIAGNARQLERVVANLIDNALKFGGAHPIDIRLTTAEGGFELVVRDYGFGMSAEDQKRVFDRYVRVVSEQHFGGLGLGLWIARRFVEAHRGTIAVESSPGAGSTFTVRLPAGAAARWTPELVTNAS